MPPPALAPKKRGNAQTPRVPSNFFYKCMGVGTLFSVEVAMPKCFEYHQKNFIKAWVWVHFVKGAMPKRFDYHQKKFIKAWVWVHFVKGAIPKRFVYHQKNFIKAWVSVHFVKGAMPKRFVYHQKNYKDMGVGTLCQRGNAQTLRVPSKFFL